MNKQSTTVKRQTYHHIEVKRDSYKEKMKRAFWYVDIDGTNIKIMGAKEGQKKFYFSTKEEAGQYASDLNTAQKSGGIIMRHAEKSVGAAIEEFNKLTKSREERGIICDSHKRGLLRNALDWLSINYNDDKFANMMCVDVTPTIVEQLLLTIDGQDQTRKHKHNTLKQVFDVAIREGWCLKNPARLAKL